MVRIMKNEMQHLHHRRHHHHLHHHHNKNISETRSGIFRKIILRDYMMRFCYFITDARTVHKKWTRQIYIVKFFWKRVLVLFFTNLVIFFNIRIYMKIYFYARTHTLFLSFRSFRLLILRTNRITFNKVLINSIKILIFLL